MLETTRPHITVRRSGERGHFDFGWLDTHHTFSFGDYFDPHHMGFRALRVINEDHVAPGTGFPTHPHRDMEIVTVVLSGALRHRDSMGNGSVIRPGEVQRMSAGTGVLHSEFNDGADEAVHLMQIWILPERKGLVPGYEQKAFDFSPGLALVASPDGREGSVTIHQDARLYRGLATAGMSLRHELRNGRHAWVQVLSGRVRVAGRDEVLEAGDGMAVSGDGDVVLEGAGEAGTADLLLFDLA